MALDPGTGKVKWYFQGVPNDFYDWDMQLSPISAMSLEHKAKLTYPLTILPGSYGGIETNMALADGVIYAPVVNLAGTLKDGKVVVAAVNFSKGKGEMVALSLADGHTIWDTKLPSMPFGDATVSNDLIFTTTFDGTLLALSPDDGKIVWKKELAAGTNAPIMIQGDTLITAAGFPQGKGQKAEIVAYRIGAREAPPRAAARRRRPAPQARARCGRGKVVFQQNCASCHTLADANAGGTVGPDLDSLKPSEAVVKTKVENGGGGMPSFSGTLSSGQISEVAAYVSAVAGKSSNKPPPASGP